MADNSDSPFKEYQGRGAATIALESRGDSTVFRRVHQTYSMDDFVQDVIDRIAGYDPNKKDFSAATIDVMYGLKFDVNSDQQAYRLENGKWDSELTSNVETDILNVMVSVYGGSLKQKDGNTSWKLEGKIADKNPVVPEASQVYTKAGIARYIVAGQSDVDTACDLMNRAPYLMPVVTARVHSGNYAKPDDLFDISHKLDGSGRNIFDVADYLLDPKDSMLSSSVQPSVSATASNNLAQLYYTQYVSELRQRLKQNRNLELPRSSKFTYNLEGMSPFRTKALLTWAGAPKDSVEHQEYLKELGLFMPNGVSASMSREVGSISNELFQRFLERCSYATSFTTVTPLSKSKYVDHILPFADVESLPFSVVPSTNVGGGVTDYKFSKVSTLGAKAYYSQAAVQKMRNLVKFFLNMHRPPGVQATDFSNLSNNPFFGKLSENSDAVVFRLMFDTINDVFDTNYSLFDKPPTRLEVTLPYQAADGRDFLSVLRRVHANDSKKISDAMMLSRYNRPHNAATVKLRLNIPTQAQALAALGLELAESKSTQELSFSTSVESFGGTMEVSRASLFEAVNRVLPTTLKTSASFDDFISFDSFPQDASFVFNRILLTYLQEHAAELPLPAERLTSHTNVKELLSILNSMEVDPAAGKVYDQIGVTELLDGGGALSVLRWMGAFFTGFFSYEIPAGVAHYMSQVALRPDSTGYIEPVYTMNVQEILSKMVGSVVDVARVDGYGIDTVEKTGRELPSFSVPESKIAEVQQRRERMGIATENSYCSKDERMSVSADGVASFFPNIEVQHAQQNLLVYSDLMEQRVALYADIGIAPSASLTGLELKENLKFLTPGDAAEREEFNEKVKQIFAVESSMLRMQPCPLLADGSLGILMGAKAQDLSTEKFETQNLATNGAIGEDLLAGYLKDSRLYDKAFTQGTQPSLIRNYPAIWALLVEAKQVPSLDQLFLESRAKWEDLASADFAFNFSPEAKSGLLTVDGVNPWPLSADGLRKPAKHERKYRFDYDMPDVLLESCRAAGLDIDAALAQAQGRENEMREEAAKFELIISAVTLMCAGGYANITTATRIDEWLSAVASAKMGYPVEGTSDSLIENFDHIQLADGRDIDNEEVFDFGQAMSSKLGKNQFHTYNFYARYLTAPEPTGGSLLPFTLAHGNYLRYYVAGQMFLDMIEAMFSAFCKSDCVLYSPLIPSIAVDTGDYQDGSLPPLDRAAKAELPSFLTLTRSLIPNLFRIHLAGNRPRGKFQYKPDSTSELLKNGKTFGVELEMPYAHGSLMSHQAAVELGQEFSAKKTKRDKLSFRQIEPGGGKTISGVAGFLMEMNRDDVRDYYGKIYTKDGAFAIDDPVLLQQELAKAPFRPLILCPKNLKANWAVDAAKFTGDKDSRFHGMLNVYQISSRVLTSRPRELIHAEVLSAPPNTLFISDYSTVNNHARRFQLCIGAQTFTTHETLNLMLQLGFTHIYCDEGHKVKNSDLEITTGIRPTVTRLAQDVLTRDNSQVVIATGTGVYNTLDDLAGIASTMQPGAFGDKNTFNAIAGRTDAEVNTRTWLPEHVRAVNTHFQKIAKVTRLAQSQWSYVLPKPVYRTHVIDTLSNTGGSLDKPVQFAPPSAGANSADMKTAIEYLWNRGFFKKWQLRSIDDVLSEFTNYFAIYWTNMLAAINDEVVTSEKKKSRKSEDEEDDDDEIEEDGGAGELYELYVKLMQFLGDPLNDDLNNPGDPLNGATVSVKAEGDSNRTKPVILPKLRLPSPKVLYLYYLLYKHFDDNLAHEAGKTDTSRPIPGRKVVVASKHKRVLAAVLQGLPEDLRAHSTMVMGTIDTSKISSEFQINAKEAQNNLESFKQNDNVWIMFCTTDKMGEGFNLQMGNRIISLEQPVTPGERLQLVSRVRRPDIGQNVQREEVYLESIVQDGTLDMTMFGLFASKYCTMVYASNTDRTDNPLYNQLSELPRLKLNLNTFKNVYTWETLRACDVSSFMSLPEYMIGKTYDYVKGIETCYEADRVDCAKLLDHNLALARKAGEEAGDPLKYLTPVLQNGVQVQDSQGKPLYKPYLLQKVQRTEDLPGTAPMLFAPALENVANGHARIFGFDVESMQTMLDVYDDYDRDAMLVNAMPVVTEFGFGRILGYDRSSVIVLFPNGMRRSFSANLITLLGNVTDDNKRFLNVMLDVEDYNAQVAKADFGERVIVTPAHCEYEFIPGQGVQKWRVIMRNGTYERTEKLGPVSKTDANGVDVTAHPEFFKVADIPPFSRSQRIMLPVARVQMNGIFWYNEHLYRITGIRNKEAGRVSVDSLSANAVGITVLCKEVHEGAESELTEISENIPFLYRELCAQGLHIDFAIKPTTVDMIWSFLFYQRIAPSFTRGSGEVASRTIDGKAVVYTRDSVLELLKKEVGFFVESYLNNSPYVFGGMRHADEHGTYFAEVEGEIVLRWTSNNMVRDKPLFGVLTKAAYDAIWEFYNWFGDAGEKRRSRFYRLILDDIRTKAEASTKCLGLGSDSEIFAAGGVQNRIKQLGVAEGLAVAETKPRVVPQFTGTETAPSATPVAATPVPTTGQVQSQPVAGGVDRRRRVPAAPTVQTPPEVKPVAATQVPLPPAKQVLPGKPTPTQVEPTLANAAGVSMQVLPLLSAPGADLKPGSFAPIVLLDFPSVAQANEFLDGAKMLLRSGTKTREFERREFFSLFSYTDLRIDSPEVFANLQEFLRNEKISLGDVAVLNDTKAVVGGSAELLAKLVDSMSGDGSFNIKAHPQLSGVRLHRFFTSRVDFDKDAKKTSGSPTKFMVNPVVLRDAKGERLHLLFRTAGNAMAFLKLRKFVTQYHLPADALVMHTSRVVCRTTFPSAQVYYDLFDLLAADLTLTPKSRDLAKQELYELMSGRVVAGHTRR